MNVISSISDAALDGNCVLSIGNFDGLHLGHQAILQTVVRCARELGVRPAVLTFDPHPIRVLAPDKAPRLISTLDQRLRLVADTGIELAFVARFDHAFAQLSPDAFIRQYIVDGLHTRAICVGSNFSFGYRQSGTVATLKQWRNEFDLIEVPPVLVRGTVVSSTQIRNLVQEGSFSRACRLMGRWFEMEGQIVSGAGRGRNVTVPTLNLESKNELGPQRGVYITRISLDGRAYLDSVTNVGIRPTFGETAQTIETYVLHDPVPSEVRTARLQFVRHLRDERRFDTPDLLRQQIGRDVGAASKFFRMLKALNHARSHSH